jgi:hypothetical protein
MTIPLWINDFTILFDKNYIFEVYPNSTMSFEEKLNAVTRLIILITILGYIFTFSNRILFIGFFTLLLLFFFGKLKTFDTFGQKDGFEVRGNKVIGLFEKNGKKNQKIIHPEELKKVLREDYADGTKKNPFSNVLLTDIMDNPEKKSAPPAFNLDVDENITKNVKRSVQTMNPTIKNTNKQLYKDMWQEFLLDQSNRVFYSMPNTKVVNDQSAFSQFLYGNMPSAKESTAEGNLQREKDSYRYTLY